MAAVRSYNSREVNFYNPAVNFSHNGYARTKNHWRMIGRLKISIIIVTFI